MKEKNINLLSDNMFDGLTDPSERLGLQARITVIEAAIGIMSYGNCNATLESLLSAVDKFGSNDVRYVLNERNRMDLFEIVYPQDKFPEKWI